MTAPQVADEVLTYYSTHFDEHTRLDASAARRARTRAYTGAVETSSYDVVLLLGPLYHLTERADRERVLAEALRVVRSGGLVVAAGIQRYAALFDHAAHGRLHLDGREERSGRVLATGRNEGREFTFAYFHRAEELAEEVRDAGVTGTRLYGVEGPGDALLKAAETATGRQVPRESDLFTSALAAARIAEEHPELLVASSHLLAFGRRPGQAARS